MNTPSKIVEHLSRHPFFIFGALAATLIQLILWYLQFIGTLPLTINQSLLAHSTLLVFCFVVWGIARVLRKNKSYKNTFDYLHEINHLYRQTLAGTTAKLLSIDNADRLKRNTVLIDAEKDTLRSIVRIVSALFANLTGKDTTTTIWLYDYNTQTCSEYISCKDGVNSIRERNKRSSYDIGENDIFASCIEKKGKCCHYLGINLKTLRKKKRYRDQRPDNAEIYQAIMTVPIRYLHNSEENRIGYLQIDQKSRNHLNDVEHLYILAALADQLYNFLSIVRRNFLFT